uniref:Putative secreted protein n=1 Tax=Ixodes ricinus TaxID=34613 RepID=A0A6B0UJI6_IXORI
MPCFLAASGSLVLRNTISWSSASSSMFSNSRRILSDFLSFSLYSDTSRSGEMLTKENGDVRVFFDEGIQDLVAYFLNVIRFHLVQQPLNHLLLFGQVTFINVGDFFLEID